MQKMTALVVLATGLCASVALGTLDVAIDIARPDTLEVLGPVQPMVRLSNVGDTDALVRVDVTIMPSGYADSIQVIPIERGIVKSYYMRPWLYGGGTQTCTAWITCPADSNHSNDTDVVIVNAAGITDRANIDSRSGIGLKPFPNPHVGNILHVGYSLNQVGPAEVSLFDIRGRVILVRDFAGCRDGVLPLDLGGLNGGVYVVRLDDGRSAATQKLVIQR